MDLSIIFKERRFNCSITTNITVKPKKHYNSNSNFEHIVPNYSDYLDNLADNVNSLNRLFSLIDETADDEEPETMSLNNLLLHEDEVNLFRSYKVGHTYADKFTNTYRIVNRDDDSITYYSNEHLGKMRRTLVSCKRTAFLEKMQFKPAYQQEAY